MQFHRLERPQRATDQPLPCLLTLIPLCLVPVVRGGSLDPVGQIKGPATDERVFKRTRVTTSVRACVWVTFGECRHVCVCVCVGSGFLIIISSTDGLRAHKHALSFGSSLKCGQEGSSDRFLINADPNKADG